MAAANHLQVCRAGELMRQGLVERFLIAARDDHCVWVRADVTPLTFDVAETEMERRGCDHGCQNQEEVRGRRSFPR